MNLAVINLSFQRFMNISESGNFTVKPKCNSLLVDLKILILIHTGYTLIVRLL